jgi:hypothetical protein
MQQPPGLMTILISVLLALVVFACGPASAAHLSHAYDRARVATTAPATVSSAALRVYDRPVERLTTNVGAASRTSAAEEADALLPRIAGGASLGPKVPIPDIPAGLTRSQFGSDVMRWGTGDAAARARIGSLTRAELGAAGVTRSMAEDWANFYRNELLRNPDNPSAAGRADLMDAAARLLQ